MAPRAAVLLGLLAVAAAGCGRRPPERPGVVTVSQEQQASWLRCFNPFAAGRARWPAQGGVYEPLMIFNSVTGAWTPWLATGYAWEGNTALRFGIREGVRWSDGRPFGPGDVVFTFELLREHPALDQGGVWGYLDRVEADGADVRFTFARPYTPGLGAIAHVPIVPRHVWERVEDPVRFDDPSPVATGPFTEVLRFEHQVFELGRNPHYWQPGRPGFDVLRMPAYPSNDQANMALVNGDVDWAGNFVPAVDRTFVSRDPEHFGYWFPLVGTTVFLYLNTTVPPFDDVRVRKALSMGIDRQRLVEVAMYGYTVPADGTGLNDVYDAWRSPEAAARARPWMTWDVDAANRLLDEAGYPRGADGRRTLPGRGGAPWSFEILIVSGWSDWIRAAQVIARGLEALGVEATVRVFDLSPWFERLQKGTFDMAIGWSNEGPTPYGFYRWQMSEETVVPVGEPAAGNWHRFGSRRATELLAAWERTTSPEEQRRLAARLQDVFVDEVPAVPLFPNPSWGVYSTRRVTGFPTRDDPYAALSPNRMPETLLVLTRLTAREPRAAAPTPAPR